MSINEGELRVLIVADDPLTRAGLAALLSSQSHCNVTGQASVDSDLTAALPIYLPDVVVWDLGWTPEASLESLAELTESGKPVVALLSDDAHAADAWSAGARGLVLRDADVERLTAALLAVSQDLIVLDPALSGVAQPRAESDPRPPIEQLTPRETEVLKLMAEGLSNRAIAFDLGISEHTVKFHVNSILTKLGAQTRTEAAVRATQLGLLLL
jgi:two-component system nitrate/nitrite response regulator NarL